MIGTPLNLRLFLKIASPLFLFANILEVPLPTKVALTPVYVTQMHAVPSEFDWAYLEHLRNILIYDFKGSGVTKVLPKNQSLEKTLHFPDVRENFEITQWKKEKIPYVISIQLYEKRLQINVFDIEKGASKKYAGLPLTGSLDQDRRDVHRLANWIQNDLFGSPGVSSLKLIYAKRVKKNQDWSSELWMCDADGGNDRCVISDEGYCVSPGFFPKEKAFYFVSYRDGQSKIYHGILGEKGSEVLISLRGSQVLPAVNRKGNQISFITDAAGSPDLFIQNLDRGKPIGKAKQLLSGPKTTHASPTYSPDGRQIAFVSDKEGTPRVYIIDIGTREQRKITHINRENTSPSWSPDGKKIAYSSKVDGVRQIWLYDLMTDTEEALTKGPENKENPSWAPDSLHLVYNTESSERCELYQLHIHQKEPILITKGAHQKRFASWVY